VSGGHDTTGGQKRKSTSTHRDDNDIRRRLNHSKREGLDIDVGAAVDALPSFMALANDPEGMVRLVASTLKTESGARLDFKGDVTSDRKEWPGPLQAVRVFVEAILEERVTDVGAAVDAASLQTWAIGVTRRKRRRRSIVGEANDGPRESVDPPGDGQAAAAGGTAANTEPSAAEDIDAVIRVYMQRLKNAGLDIDLDTVLPHMPTFRAAMGNAGILGRLIASTVKTTAGTLLDFRGEVTRNLPLSWPLPFQALSVIVESATGITLSFQDRMRPSCRS
jgi:hypothetical protein